MGPNGSGKTTILKLIATLTVPTSGRIEVLGIDAVREPAKVRRLLGLGLADDRSFYYRLSARANLEFFGALGGLRGKRLRERIVHCARLFDVDRDLDRLYGTFSTGMRHRLALARALLSDGAVL
ncbi:MAG: ATP-binding cassette domain-containing protein, partial [Rhodanobacteraceae bacterium]